MENQKEIQLLDKKQSYLLKIPFSKSNMKWFGLFLACFLLFGDAYAFDNPMALQSTIQEDMDLNNLQFNMLYSIYSLPNIILPFFGGMLIDRIGVRYTIFIFSSILIIGQSIVVIAGYTLVYVTMLAGRFIFGVGSESLNAAQAAIMSHWFHGGEVSLSLGLCLAIPKLGSALNSIVSPIVQNEYNSLGFTLLIGLFIVIFSWLCGIGLIYLDKENENRLKAGINYSKETSISSKKSSNKSPEKYFEELSLQEINRSFKSEQNTEYQPDSEDTEQQDQTQIEDQNDQQFDYQAQLLNESLSEIQDEENEPSTPMEEVVENIKLSDIKELDGSYWILACIIMLSEALFVPFLDNGNQFMQVKYGFTSKQAGSLLTIPYVFSAILTPFIGCYSDRIKQRTLLIVITTLIFIVTHLFLLLISCESACSISAVPLFFLGICYSLYSAILIPSIPLVVKPQMIGTAFGLVGVLQNTALAIFPLITGSIYKNHLINQDGQIDPFQGYEYQSFFFVGVSFINFLIAISLYIFDKNGSKKLSRLLNKK